VRKLLKFLYGLKQEPKQWHEKFNETLLSDGFSFNDVDRCVYTKSVNDDCVIICLYVNDMFTFDTCINIVLRTKSFMASKFDMKDMGETSVILGIKIIRKGDNILLSQGHYVEKLLRKFGYYDSKSMSIPYNANSQLKKNRGEPMDQTQYAQTIGHLMNFFRPNIAYATGRLCRYTQS